MRPELAALLALANPAAEAAADALVRVRGAGAWRRFCAMAEREGIAGHLWFELRRRRLGNVVPWAAAERLRESYVANLHTNTWRLRELRALTTAWQAGGLAEIPLDACALFMHNAYPDRGVRKLDRLMLAAGAAQRDAAHRALAAAGCRIEWETADAIGAVSARTTLVRVEFFAGGPVPTATHALGLTAKRLDAAGSQGPLTGEIDRFYLLRLDGALPHTTLPFADPPALARGLAQRTPPRRMVTQLISLFFPPPDEMVRRHGAHATGLGLYRLYAGRLLRMRAELPDRRDEPPRAG